MIQIVTGKLGAGKTLFSVSLMLDDFAKGLTVATNVKIEFGELAALVLARRRIVLDPAQFVAVDPGKNKNWHETIPYGVRGHPVKVYLDEIHLFFNARDWAKTNAENRGLLSFLTQSRKAFVDVTFIAQEITTVERQFRVLAEWELAVVNSSHVPLGVLGRCPFSFFIVTKRDTLHGNVLDKRIKAYDKGLFPCYNSFQMLDEAMQELADNAVRVDRFKLCKLGLIPWLGFVLRRLIPQSKPATA